MDVDTPALQDALDNGSTTGICSFMDNSSMVRQIAKDLGWYSGNTSFPIEHPTDVVEPDVAYFRVDGDMYNPDDAYCVRRRVIAERIIAHANRHQ